MTTVTLQVRDAEGNLSPTVQRTITWTGATPGTRFGAYPGPLTVGGDAQSATARARVARALGVPVLPADRVYSETGYGKAALSPSPIVAVSYKQVQALAAGDSATITALTNEMKALAQRPQRFDVADDHEVDNKVNKGAYTIAQYADSAKRFRDIVHGIGASNLRTAFCTMAWSYLPGVLGVQPGNPVAMFNAAGADCFDLLAPDAYYTSGYSTPAKILGPVTTWSLAQGKPLAVWECGWQTTGQANPNYTEAQRQARAQAQIDWWRTNGAAYVLWFEALKDDDNLLEGHPLALAAYSAAAQS